MPRFSEQGIAVLPVVVLGIIILAAGVYFARGVANLKSPEFVTNTPVVYHSPSPSPVMSPSLYSSPPYSSPPVSSGKKPSVSPSPSFSPSPTGKPSPKPGVFSLKASYDDTEVNLKTKYQNYGEGGRALIVDSNGDVVSDQKDFKFIWSIDDPDLVHFESFRPTHAPDIECLLGIKPPCPEMDFVTSAKDKTGETKVHLKVTHTPDNAAVGELTYNIHVTTE